MLNSLTPDVAIAALPTRAVDEPRKSSTLCASARLCRKLGAALVLDLTQSLGALPFSVRDVQPDFAVAACYKWLLGPYSVGLLYVAPKWQGGMPLEENWIQRANARDFASLILYTDTYDTGARLFDMGERSNFALLPAALRSMKQLLEWKVAQISETIGVLNRQLAEAAANLGFSAPAEPLRAPHYLALRRKGAFSKEFPEMLAREKVFVSVRGSSIRVTPHVYNTVEERRPAHRVPASRRRCVGPLNKSAFTSVSYISLGTSNRKKIRPPASQDQLGKGFRDEFLNDRIKSRTLERRSNSVVSSRSSSSTAESYHSGGICSTSCQSELSGKLSIRLSQGSKLSHPVILAYTSLRPKTPRSGASGKLHSPALKQ